MVVLFAGDFCPQLRVKEAFEAGQFSQVLGEVKAVVDRCDYSIVNLECPITSSNSTPIVKQGPNLQCGVEAIDAIKFAGINCATLANNHFRDFGDEGCKDTIKELTSAGLDYVGGGYNRETANKVKYVEVEGARVAIINVCESEFSIATECSYGAAPIDVVENYYHILEARNNSDFVVIVVHSGNEHYQLPSLRLKKMFHWYIDIGCDVVINSHQHCYSGYENYKGKMIFYGLGNFCFDGNRSNKQMWHEGYMVKLEINNVDIADYTFTLLPYIQCKEDPTIKLMNEKERACFFRELQQLNSIILDDGQLERRYSEWCKSRYMEYEQSLSPFSGRITSALLRRHLLPSFITRKKAVSIYDNVNCESRRDVLLEFLNSKIKEHS